MHVTRGLLKGAAEDAFACVQRLVFPVLFIYTYFTFNSTYAISYFLLKSLPVLVIFVVYQVLILIVGFCYFRMTIITNATTLELFPEIESEEHRVGSSESLHLNPFEVEQSVSLVGGAISTCPQCRTYQPPRAYHCFKCHRCYLLMVKHSRWFDVCVCFANYKFYVVFLFYALVTSLLSLGSLIHGLAAVLSAPGSSNPYFTLMTIAISTGAIVVAILAWEGVEAVYSILRNQTPRERSAAGKRDVRVYDLGASENWRDIMGEKWYMWFLPTWTSAGDGVSFPIGHKPSSAYTATVHPEAK